MNEYSINCSESVFYKLFPPKKFFEYKCEFCGEILVADRHSKTNNTGYRNYELYCPNCFHKPFTECKCSNCLLKEIEIERSERKIKELEAKLLQDKNLSVFEKRMLKNRISANEYSLSTNNINKNALENDIRKRLNKELQNLPRETSEFLNDKAYSEIIDSISNPWSENEELISSVTNNVSQKWVDYQIDVIRMTESNFYTTSPAFVPKGGK